MALYRKGSIATFASILLCLCGVSYAKTDEVVSSIHTDKKVIALTFDDGPNPVFTPKILDILKQYNANATFFVLGKRVGMYPKLVIREVNEGHEIANHTFDHQYLKGSALQRAEQEVVQTQEAIYDTIEQVPHIFRPPGGIVNPSVINVAKQQHCQIVLWSWYQDTRDWKKPGVDKIVRTVLSNVHNGDIVLFHDFEGDCSQTVEALKIILPELQKQGYQFLTVTDLLQTK
ncbi:polysaccharide deacetylase family protein [Fodinisporobacter ferrooxydans]|uniref:Polysaccharide deacetylase family protein n=1 Tax=Fodinisporobacter ferrooxydans TaxID=2901836 RepID=A0ABY4CQR8_9BACL|nr:polysaccharide deacetylase family protein [Alicyclobacillaceae bacterium MYW30-H2]